MYSIVTEEHWVIKVHDGDVADLKSSIATTAGAKPDS